MVEVKSITLEGVNFNATFLSKKTEIQFIREFEKTSVFSQYPLADKRKLLKEAYLLCVEAVKPKKEKAAEIPAQNQ